MTDSQAQGGWQRFATRLRTWRSHHRNRRPSEQLVIDYLGDNRYFRSPRDLSVGPTPVSRILVIGSCLTEWIADMARTADPAFESDFLLAHNLTVDRLPDAPPRPIDTYDFQVVQIPLREVFPSHIYFRLPYTDLDAWEGFLEDRCQDLRLVLRKLLRYNDESGLLTFAANFLVPQQNPMGRLMPRSDPRNLVCAVNRLNDVLAEEVSQHPNAYTLDFDQIAATFGKKYIQDDVVWFSAHGSLLANYDQERDQSRIEPTTSTRDYFTIRTEQFRRAVWTEVLSLYRTIRRIDSVKLVVVDLDDTLWRGVIAEEGEIGEETLEGWPLGIVEALCFLKKRGVLLGIVSKNDEATIERLWPAIFRDLLSPSDFAIRKINWEPKVGNLESVMSQLNLLPRNVVYVDDNPAERRAVSLAFPDMRVLGRHLYHLRRILLWAPEMQTAHVTDESARRTEMVQAQIHRDSARSQISREEFLRDLDLRVRPVEIRSTTHPRFARCLELLNKTNQFNTSGRRWLSEECASFFGNEGMFVAFEAEDRFTNYGLVGVSVISIGPQDWLVSQFVMSCRVIGMEVEIAVLSDVAHRASLAGAHHIGGRLIETDANFPARDLFERAGFSAHGAGDWMAKDYDAVNVPPHVTLEAPASGRI